MFGKWKNYNPVISTIFAFIFWYIHDNKFIHAALKINVFHMLPVNLYLNFLLSKRVNHHCKAANSFFAKSPKELGMDEDTRALGVGLIQILLD